MTNYLFIAISSTDHIYFVNHIFKRNHRRAMSDGFLDILKRKADEIERDYSILSLLRHRERQFVSFGVVDNEFYSFFLNHVPLSLK